MKQAILCCGIAIAALSYRPDYSQRVYRCVLIVCGVVGGIVGVVEALKKRR